MSTCLSICSVARRLRGILLLCLSLACTRSARAGLCASISGSDCGSGCAGYISAFFIVPRGNIVFRALRIEAGIESVFRKLESLLNNEGRVGVVENVVLGNPTVLDCVIDQPAKKSDVCPCTNLKEHVGN